MSSAGNYVIVREGEIPRLALSGALFATIKTAEGFVAMMQRKNPNAQLTIYRLEEK